MRARAIAVAVLMSIGTVASLSALEVLSGQTSRLTISGGSTLRAWTCSTSTVRGSVQTTGGTAGTSIADLPAGTHAVSIVIPVSTIDCRNGTMNGHLRRALDAERNPEILFDLTRYTVSGIGQVHAEGNLTVAGRATPIRMDATVLPAPDGVRASGRVQLRMTELGVEPPTLMLGTLKVHDPIAIEFDVYLPHAPVALR